MAPTTRPKPIPDAYRRVTPCLVVQGGGKALEFYAAVFGAAERMRVPGPGGTVAHAEVQIGDSVVIIEDESPERGTTAPPPGGVAGSPSSLFIYVEDVDAVVARAVELGATLQRAPRTSSTATATGTSWTRSGMDGRSRRTWRTWRRRSWCGGWPSCRPRPSPPLLYRVHEARSFYVDTLGLTPFVEGEDVLAFRCADGTDFGVFVSPGPALGHPSQVTFFCQNLDAEVADLRARGVQFEEFDMPGATVKDGVYDLNGQRGVWFRGPEGNLLAVAERPDDSLS